MSYQSVKVISRRPALESFYRILNFLYLKQMNNIQKGESWWLREIVKDPGVHVAITCTPTSSDSLVVTVWCVWWLIQEEYSGLLEGVRDMGTQPHGWSRRGFLSVE
jgi:hypothetical protein